MPIDSIIPKKFEKHNLKYYNNISIDCKISKIKVFPYSLVVMSGELGALWVL